MRITTSRLATLFVLLGGVCLCLARPISINEEAETSRGPPKDPARPPAQPVRPSATAINTLRSRPVPLRRKFRLAPKPTKYHRGKLLHHAKLATIKTGQALTSLPLHVGAGASALALSPLRAAKEVLGGQKRQAARTLWTAALAPLGGLVTGSIDAFWHARTAVMDTAHVLYHGVSIPISKARDIVAGKSSDQTEGRYLRRLKFDKKDRYNKEKWIFDDEAAHIARLYGSNARTGDVRLWRKKHRLFQGKKPATEASSPPVRINLQN